MLSTFYKKKIRFSEILHMLFSNALNWASLKYGNFSYVKWINTFQHTSQLLTPVEKKAFKNIVGKKENPGNQHFLIFPQCFPHSRKNFSF